MRIEIHQPKLEALMQQRLATGRFRNVEDVLFQALEAAETISEPAVDAPRSLGEVFAMAREILASDELIIERDPSPGRPIELS